MGREPGTRQRWAAEDDWAVGLLCSRSLSVTARSAGWTTPRHAPPGRPGYATRRRWTSPGHESGWSRPAGMWGTRVGQGVQLTG